MKKIIYKSFLLFFVVVLILSGCRSLPSASSDSDSSESSSSSEYSYSESSGSSIISESSKSDIEESSESSVVSSEESSDSSIEEHIDVSVIDTDLMLYIDNMTLEQKVGQLFILRPDALDFNLSNDELADNSVKGTQSVNAQMKSAYEKYPCGGFVLFKKNIGSPDQLKRFTSELHALNELTPIISVDEEGGSITRIGNRTEFNERQFSDMETIAQSGDLSKAYEVGAVIGSYLGTYGFDCDFAPVADVNTNPENTVIGARAFGSEPVLAGKMVGQVILGLHDNGIMSCIKHFPGHGDTLTDTHKGYAETLKTWDEIKSCEMIPFISGISADTDMVMVAHIAAPKVTGTSEPASISYKLITEKLRGELGYDGVVITDAFAMNAITDEYDSGEAAALAIKAGVDIILMPDNYVQAFEGIINAVESGEITEQRIDESLVRIITLKNKYIL